MSLELLVFGPRHVVVRVGRWSLRSWRPFRLEGPPGYESTFPVYLVQGTDAGGHDFQFGGFVDQAEAEKLIARLESEGRSVHLNVVPIHRRWQDYEFDR